MESLVSHQKHVWQSCGSTVTIVHIWHEAPNLVHRSAPDCVCVCVLACQVGWWLFLCNVWVINTQTPLSSDMEASVSDTATCGLMIICTLTFCWLFLSDARRPQCFLSNGKWKMLQAGLQNRDYFTLITNWTFTTFLFVPLNIFFI